MATINFGGVNEHVVTREEFPLEKAVKTLKSPNICMRRGYSLVKYAINPLLLRHQGFNINGYGDA